MEKINLLNVFYGDNEYASHVANHDLARQYAAQNQSHWPLLVHTIEHGGWSMVHYFDGEHPTGVCVGTANDMARWSDEQIALRNKIFMMERNNLGDVRRSARVTVPAPEPEDPERWDGMS